MRKYFEIINDIKANGDLAENRTGVNTLAVFGRMYRYSMKDGLPILTTRKQDFRKIVGELLWFIKGDSSCQYLDDNKIGIWSQWTHPLLNTVGPMYPTQLRKWQGKNKVIDQLQQTIDQIKNNPTSRRHVITYWNPDVMPDESLDPIENVALGNPALAPCHTLLNFNVRHPSLFEALCHPINRFKITGLIKKHDIEEYLKSKHKKVEDLVTEYVTDRPENGEYIKLLTKVEIENVCMLAFYLRDNNIHDYEKLGIRRNALNLLLYQRSWDVGAAGGWNVTQYSILLHIVAELTGMIPCTFIHSVGDVHIYVDQLTALAEQELRDPYPLPTLVFNREITSIDDIEIDDISLLNYQHHSSIKIPVAT